jgi:hypothetical protein
VLDAHFERFVAGCRVLLPPWFLEAADQALREGRRPDADDEVM